MRGELGFVFVAAHRSQEAAHLGKRGAAGLLDVSERVTVLSQSLGEFVPDGADLEHHHADCMGDDVVQLARDPYALLCHCDPRGRVPFPLGLGHGLVGVRERVKIYGGEMSAGTANGSGFILSTRLPLSTDRR